MRGFCSQNTLQRVQTRTVPNRGVNGNNISFGNLFSVTNSEHLLTTSWLYWDQRQKAILAWCKVTLCSKFHPWTFMTCEIVIQRTNTLGKCQVQSQQSYWQPLTHWTNHNDTDRLFRIELMFNRVRKCCTWSYYIDCVKIKCPKLLLLDWSTTAPSPKGRQQLRFSLLVIITLLKI